MQCPGHAKSRSASAGYLTYQPRIRPLLPFTPTDRHRERSGSVCTAECRVTRLQLRVLYNLYWRNKKCKRTAQGVLRTILYDVTRTSRLPFGFESETRTERSLPRPGRLDLPRAPPAPRHAHRPWAARHEDRVPRRAPRRRQHARAPPRVGLLAENVLARRACAPGYGQG